MKLIRRGIFGCLVKKTWVFMLALILLLVLAACGGGDDTSGDDGEADADNGDYDLNDSYTVVSDNSFVPFEFMEDGELVGFDIELITAVAEEAGFEIDGEIQTTNFDGIIPGLQTGQFEIAVAGISITEERKVQWISVILIMNPVSPLLSQRIIRILIV